MTIIDVHVLQTLPPSLINRDDSNAPKTAIFGGVSRQRVSSQAWKRAVRQDFRKNFAPQDLGYRTKDVVRLIVEEIERQTDGAWDKDKATQAAEQALTTAGFKLVEPKSGKASDESDQRAQSKKTGYLLFVGSRQISALAESIIHADGEKLTKKEVSRLLDTEHSVDIAMFGRMVADDAAYNVDASVQVAHAIGIHESEPEFDFFTAVDDIVAADEESGAGMMGTVQLMSSTLYRFATLDLESLTKNLGDEVRATTSALAFVRSFILSLPTGKQNTFAHNSLPDLVYITVRNDRSVSLVGAFENPVVATAQGRRRLGAEALAREEKELRDAYGLQPCASFVFGLEDLVHQFHGLAEKIILPQLEEKLKESINSESA